MATPESDLGRRTTDLDEAQSDAASDEHAPGACIGRFVVEERLGAGAMGVVYAARDPELDRRVAIKLILATGNDERLRARLVREAQALARVAHPNVVVVHEVGSHGAQVYVAMELVRGQTLRDWLRVPRTTAEIVRVLVDAGRGLAAAHAAKLIHRDFKPDNVLIGDDGRARVTDFGLARLRDDAADDAPGPANGPSPHGMRGAAGDARAADPPSPGIDADGPSPHGMRGAAGDARAADPLSAGIDADGPSPHEMRGPAGDVRAADPPSPARALAVPLTRTGALVGTPVYASPEQLARTPAGPASDQFSFCVTAYEALYGVRPFRATTLAELTARVSSGQVAPPPHGRRVPGRVHRAVLRGLRTRPDERFPSMDALLAALDPGRSRRIAVAAVAAVAAAGAAGLVFALGPSGAPTCADEGAAIATQWSPAAAAALRARIVGRGAPLGERVYGGVAASYTRYADAWTAMRTRACTVRRGGDEAAARTIACLDARRAGLAENLATVAEQVATGTLAGVPMVVTFLEPIATCAHPAAASQFDETWRARHAMLEASQLWMAGKRDAALRQFDELLAALEPLGYPPIRAEVMIAIAALAILDRDLARAASNLRSALAVAEAAGDDRVKLAAAAKLARVLVQQGEVDEAARVVELADASLARLGGDVALEGELAAARGGIALAREQLADAARHYAQALDLAAGIGDPSVVALAYSPLIDIETRRGRLDEVRALRARFAGAPAVTPGAADHAIAAAARRLEHCGEAWQHGDLDTALARCSDTVAAIAAEVGPDAPILAQAHGALSFVLALRGDRPGARAHALSAVAIYDAAGVKDKLAEMLLRAADHAMELDDHAAALALYQRAAAIATALGRAGDAARTLARSGVGRALAATRQDAAALVELEWSLRRLEVMSLPSRNRAPGVQLALADVLWRRAGPDDRARARVLATAARAGARADRAALDARDPLTPIHARSYDELLARIEAWISAHR